MKRNTKGLLAALFDGDQLRKRSICFVYHGSATEASSDRNPPVQMVALIAPTINTYGSILGTATAQSTQRYDNGGALWYYRSSDPTTLAMNAGYFTDGQSRGMKTGDVMMVVEQSSYGTSPTFKVGVLVSTNCTTSGVGSTGAFNMAIGSVISSS